MNDLRDIDFDLNNQNIVINPSSEFNQSKNKRTLETSDVSPAAIPVQISNEEPKVSFYEEQKGKLASTLLESVASKATEGCCSKLNFVNILQPYFQVNNKQILERIKNSVIPLNKTFYETAMGSYDLYGPFWITTTLILTICTASTINQMISPNKVDSQFMIQMISISTSLV